MKERLDFSKFFAGGTKQTTVIFPLTESRREGDECFTNGLIAWKEGRNREAFVAWEQAQQAYLKRIRYNGGDAETHYRLFDIAFKMGNPTEIEQFFQSAMKLYEQELSCNPSRDKVVFERMAEMCGKIGRSDQKIEYQKKAQQILERGFGSYFAAF